MAISGNKYFNSVYQVTFPEAVKWLVIEFDPQCSTAQNEDTLQLYVPTKTRDGDAKWFSPAKAPEAEEEMKPRWWPVLKRFKGITNWPEQAVVLPGMVLLK